MRVLHLIDGTGGPGGGLDEAAAWCGLLMRGSRSEQSVCVVGPTRARRRLEELGVPVTLAVPAALGRPVLAWRTLRMARSLGVDVVHCWGGGMLDLSRLAFAAELGRVAVVRQGSEGLLALAAEWLGAPMSRAVILGARAHQSRLQERYAGTEVRAVPPPVEASSGSTREALRARLGIGKDESALLALGPDADALRIAYLQGLLECAGRRLVAVLPRGAAQMARGRRLRGRTQRWLRLITAPQPGGELAAACDVGLWDPGGTGPTSHREYAPGEGTWDVAPALAAGLPLVVPRGALDPGTLPAGTEGACEALNGTLPELARAVVALIEDAAARARVAGAFRSHARALDWGGGFARAVEHAWEQVGPGAQGRPSAAQPQRSASGRGLAV